MSAETKPTLFLFQRGYYTATEDYDTDKYSIFDGEAYHMRNGIQDDEPMPDEEAVNLGVLERHWVSERVFLKEAEAEAFGHDASYLYLYTGGWRVFPVPCEGSLASLVDRNAKESESCELSE